MAKAKPAKAAKKPPKAASRPDRLDAPAWIAAAFDTLADHGIDAVRVEPLAKVLAVTKGSFYWHFTDRRALIDAMLAQWSEARIEAIRSQAGGAGSPTVILLRLADLYTRHGNVRGLAIELAIRALARSDDGAAKAVRAVDSERLKHVTALFEQLGWPAGDAKARAVLFYSYLFGQSLLDPKLVTASTIDIAVEALLAPPG
jgi:AcrR family transcriptional regulator